MLGIKRGIFPLLLKSETVRPYRDKKKRSKFDIRHKETLTLFLREYFELFFPELAERMQFETARFLDKELIALFGDPANDDERDEVQNKTDEVADDNEKEEEDDESNEDQDRITDALILIQITLDGKPEWILIHWEQESRRKKGFEERMFHYFCGIYFKFRKLVFPIAMFTDPHKWRKPVVDTYNLSLLRYQINEFTYSLIKLKNYKAEEFEKRIAENPLYAAYLPLTDYPKEERSLIKAKAMNSIAKIPPGQKRATLYSLIQESTRLNEQEEEQFRKLVQDNPMYKEAKMLQSIEEVGIEKGLEQGLVQGWSQAMEKTARDLLLSRCMTNKKIAEITGMDISRINKLAKALKSD